LVAGSGVDATDKTAHRTNNAPMWKDLRSRLERWGLLPPLFDRLTLRGAIHFDVAADRSGTAAGGTLLSICAGGGPSALLAVAADGRFQLELPLHRSIRITIVHQGHLPRVIEIQPLRTGPRSARDPVHVRCHLEVMLTPRLDNEGQAARPLRERITMPAHNRPLIAEWDHVMHAEHREEFVPLFARGF
jgi:hypothetical protein